MSAFVLPDIKLAILDLDSTVRFCTVPGQPCPNRMGEQGIYPGWPEILLAWYNAGVAVRFASNQGGVRHGHLSHAEARAAAMETMGLLDPENAFLSTANFSLAFRGTDYYDAKPNPGMIIRHMINYEFAISPIRLDETVFIGDWTTDLEAARRAGCRFLWAWEVNPNVPVNTDVDEGIRRLEGRPWWR